MENTICVKCLQEVHKVPYGFTHKDDREWRHFNYKLDESHDAEPIVLANLKKAIATQ